ncbi:hypothetical protein BB559_001658 [Furculomyces boomerangus]|uniref:Uncharacterized protein n=1 Tax=Furculomyces boomerangus TaxID=61424 RepID=A0A2T9Z147_9FUNG|nr:hypothetical protein BB559_001658 [Furculomyces boomerangus]
MEYTPSPSNNIGMSIQDKKIDSQLADIQILIEDIATHITRIRTGIMFKGAGIKSKAPQISTESINLLVNPKATLLSCKGKNPSNSRMEAEYVSICMKQTHKKQLGTQNYFGGLQNPIQYTTTSPKLSETEMSSTGRYYKKMINAKLIKLLQKGGNRGGVMERGGFFYQTSLYSQKIQQTEACKAQISGESQKIIAESIAENRAFECENQYTKNDSINSKAQNKRFKKRGNKVGKKGTNSTKKLEFIHWKSSINVNSLASGKSNAQAIARSEKRFWKKEKD